METTNKPEKTLAFINDKSPILDAVCNDLIDLGFEVLYRSEHIEDGITQLSALEKLPKVCIIDLDFHDRNILAELQELHTKYSSVKLISDVADLQSVTVSSHKHHFNIQCTIQICVISS